MANPKNLKTWKRETLAYHTSLETIQRQSEDYLKWLATKKGWLTSEVRCKHCAGLGEQSWYGGGRRRTSRCRYCSYGIVSVSSPVPDTSRATAYVQEQVYELERRAHEAVDGIKHRLFWRGLRPVVSNGGIVHSLAEYDEREQRRAELYAAFNAARKQANQARNVAEIAWQQGGTDINDDSPYAPVCAAERESERLRQELYKLGEVNLSRWFIPGTGKTIHVGITPARRGYGYVPPTYSIIINPGLSPSSYELDAIAEKAISAVIENNALCFAA